MPETFHTIRWSGAADGHLVLLDQTRLPSEAIYLDCRSAEEVWQAIRRLSVRGAPAIGVAAAYGVCVGVQEGRSVEDVCDYLATSRPTGANLFWALERMRRVASQPAAESEEPSPSSSSPRPVSDQKGCGTGLLDRLLEEAKAIHEEDRQQCAAMGRYGADLLAELPEGAGILTHCNTGALATGGDGTAAAVIYELARRNKRPHVYADETRPLLQGARLTMWELEQRGIDATLICDSAAAHVMREGMVRAVITGADRVAANGDTANKIGTYSVATLARAHGIPFYVAAPTTTFDLALASGTWIPIEQRPSEEVTHFQCHRPLAGADSPGSGLGRSIAPVGVDVYNPAFDITPAELITAIVTDRGIVVPVDAKSVRNVLTRTGTAII